MFASKPLSHLQAIALMVLATLMWSIAGVVTRQIQVTPGFEVTFWRSALAALSLALILAVLWRRQSGSWAALGPRVRRTLRQPALWLSGLCWSGMFTFFMLALTRTSVANVLLTSALTPMMTALLSLFLLRQRISGRTWAAIAACTTGIVYMYADSWLGGAGSGASESHKSGILLALLVPLSAAVNWTVIQHQKQRAGAAMDMVPAVILGGVLSAAYTLPASWPLQANAHDMALLLVLGLFQLAIPCALVVLCQRILQGPEVALLSLLETVFGVTWAWVFVHEVPTPAVLLGAGLVLSALVANEAAAFWEARP